MSTIIVPPAHPLPSLAAPTSPPFDAAALTPAQQASLASLVAHFSSADLKLALPSTPTPELCTPVAYTEVLTEAEQFWLSEECLLRFLRATKWDEGQARDRLAKTLAWRREFGIEGLTKEYLSCVALISVAPSVRTPGAARPARRARALLRSDRAADTTRHGRRPFPRRLLSQGRG